MVHETAANARIAAGILVCVKDIWYAKTDRSTVDLVEGTAIDTADVRIKLIALSTGDRPECGMDVVRIATTNGRNVAEAKPPGVPIPVVIAVGIYVQCLTAIDAVIDTARDRRIRRPVHYILISASDR